TPGAPNTALIEWMYVSCSKTPGAAQASGSCSFAIPGGPLSGNHNMPLLRNDGYTAVASSGAFTVTGGLASTVLSVSPVSVGSAGGNVTTTWAGIATPRTTDWSGP